VAELQEFLSWLTGLLLAGFAGLGAAILSGLDGRQALAVACLGGALVHMVTKEHDSHWTRLKTIIIGSATGFVVAIGMEEFYPASPEPLIGAAFAYGYRGTLDLVDRWFKDPFSFVKSWRGK